MELGLIEVYNDGKTLEIKKFDQRRRSPSKFPKPPEPEPSPNCPSNDGQLPALGQHQAGAETKTETATGAWGTPKRVPTGAPVHTHPRTSKSWRMPRKSVAPKNPHTSFYIIGVPQEHGLHENHAVS